MGSYQSMFTKPFQEHREVTVESLFPKYLNFLVLHLQSKDIHILAMLKRNSVHRSSSPTGNTKNIWSADPRRNASLSSHTQGVKEFLSGEIILAKMGLFAELEF